MMTRQKPRFACDIICNLARKPTTDKNIIIVRITKMPLNFVIASQEVLKKHQQSAVMDFIISV